MILSISILRRRGGRVFIKGKTGGCVFIKGKAYMGGGGGVNVEIKN